MNHDPIPAELTADMLEQVAGGVGSRLDPNG